MRKLLFVGGFPSGGTDLTKTILNAHPDIHLNGEMPLLPQLARHGYAADSTFSTMADIEALQRCLQKLDVFGNLEAIDVDAKQMVDELPLSLDALTMHLFSDRDVTVWGNKTPQNTENMMTLHKLFPHARFIVVVRDVRDVCLSWRKKWGKDMYWCADKWRKRMALGLDTAYLLPSEQILIIKYEDWLENLERQSQQVCSFLGVPFSLRMVEHHRYTDDRIDGKLHYGQAVITANHEKWRTQLSQADVTRIEEIAFSTMRRLDYLPEYAQAEVGLTNWERRLGRLRDGIALVSVGNRASSDNSWSRRLSAATKHVRKQLLQR